MSLRPGGAAATKPTSAARLDAVLRAGQSFALVTKTRGQAEEDDVDSGLTKALKNASLVPTGVCLPRGFDPDYCAYDRYYAVGVALVSAVLGALVEADVPSKLTFLIMDHVKDKLTNMCYTPPSDAYSTLMGKNVPFRRLSYEEKKVAWEQEFTPLCRSLESAYNDLGQTMVAPLFSMPRQAVEQKAANAYWEKCDAATWFDWFMGYDGCSEVFGGSPMERFGEDLRRAKNDAVVQEMETNPAFRLEILVRKVISLIMLPGSMLGSSTAPVGEFGSSGLFIPGAAHTSITVRNKANVAGSRLPDSLAIMSTPCAQC